VQALAAGVSLAKDSVENCDHEQYATSQNGKTAEQEAEPAHDEARRLERGWTVRGEAADCPKAPEERKCDASQQNQEAVKKRRTQKAEHAFSSAAERSRIGRCE
jgi:hypothetical protein